MKNFYLLSVLLLMAFALIYSCSTEEEDTTPPPSIVITPKPEPEPPAPTQYTLTVTAGEGGTVSSNGGTYDEGTSVTITATPNEGYEFVGWEGSDSDSFSLNITLNGNSTLRAIFEIKMPNYERYSSLNETTSSFHKQKYFYRYLTFDEYKSLTFYSINENNEYLNCDFTKPPSQGGCSGIDPYYAVHGNADTWGDFDNDGKLDFFASMWKFTNNGFGNELTKNLFVSNYFSSEKIIKFYDSNFINWFAPSSIGDFDNDGRLDVWMHHNNRHNNSSNNNGNNTGGENQNIQPGPGVLIFFDENGINELPVGPSNMDAHFSSSGDIDNDGDIDMIIFPWQVTNNISESPKIILNKGGRIFETIDLLEDYESFVEKFPNAWNALFFNIFDIDNDGNMDILGATMLSDRHLSEIDPNFQYFEEFAPQLLGFHNNRKPWIIWGSDKLQYNSSNIQLLNKLNYRHDYNNALGSAFTDFDNDGDIDLLILSTIASNISGDTFYRNYELTLFENKGNRVFEDVTSEKIDYYFNMDARKFGEFYSVVMIDKDNDGDFDIVPYGNGASFDGKFIRNLYWENTGGQFVRREND